MFLSLHGSVRRLVRPGVQQLCSRSRVGLASSGFGVLVLEPKSCSSEVEMQGCLSWDRGEANSSDKEPVPRSEASRRTMCRTWPAILSGRLQKSGQSRTQTIPVSQVCLDRLEDFRLHPDSQVLADLNPELVAQIGSARPGLLPSRAT